MRKILLQALVLTSTVASTLDAGSLHAQRVAQQPLGACHGSRVPLRFSGQSPYVEITVGGQRGHFLIDSGTNTSYVDTTAFAVTPRPSTGNMYVWSGFPHYWSQVSLQPRSYSWVNTPGLRQAGIIGTDILAVVPLTIDYDAAVLYAQPTWASFCPDSTLYREGFTPAWTIGYYPTDANKISPEFPRVPTVPVRIGDVAAIAQVDLGYDDSVDPHTVIVNDALFRVMQAANVPLDSVGYRQYVVCGIQKRAPTYRLREGARFEVVGTNNQAVIAADDAILQVQRGEIGSKQCPGVSTWSMPAAHIGASFLRGAGRVIFDPLQQKVWFGRRR